MNRQCEKPPIGLAPRYIDARQRQEDILKAIERAKAGGGNIQPEWAIELSELVRYFQRIDSCTHPVENVN